MTEPMKTITIVVPAYNEEDVLEAFHRELTTVIDRLPYRFTVLFVNDGSTDGTAAQIGQLRKRDPRVALINLSRNFGKDIALMAGIDCAEGDAAVFIDADLQDPPEVIPQLIVKWEEGYDVAYGQRQSRSGESWLKVTTANAFYRVMQRLGDRVRIPADTGDFRLMNRRSLDALEQLREHHRFMKGLFAWVGFRQAAVRYHRRPRHAGKTKWNYWKLWNFSIEGITSFTITPLKFATYFGLIVGLFSFVFAVAVIYKTLVYGDSVAGYPSLMTVILFLGGVQLVAIGIIGEYLGRVFNETKKRPLYLVQDFLPAQEASQKGQERALLGDRSVAGDS